MPKAKTLEKLAAPEGSPFLSMSKVELVLDGSAGAKDELYRRAYNRYVESQTS